MKKKFLIILLLTNCLFVFAQEVYEKPVVDERVELMSIIFRLAGVRQYAENTIPLYDNEIDKYFEKYKNHPLIKYTKKLQNENGYGFSLGVAPRFAILLEIKNGKIAFNKNIKTDISDSFNQDNIPKYLKLLNNFYKKTKFYDFFINNEKIRKITEKNFANEITNKINFNWFKSFFRFLPEKKFRIIISLLGSYNNFGPTLVYKDGSEEYYSIIGCGSVDENGFPIFKGRLGDMSNTLIHEICHSFCNSPILEYQDELLPQANIFYQFLNESFYHSPLAYLHEIFARACAFQYNKDNNNNDNVKLNMPNEINAGYLWLPQLLEAFGKYKNDTTYKTFKDFMPEIVKLQNSLDPQKLYDEIPEITGTNIENSSDSVDYNIDHITVYFTKPMYKENSYATLAIRATPQIKLIEKSRWNDRIIGEDKWNDEGTEWTFYLKNLEPNTQYKISIYEGVFKDKNHKYIPKDGYTLTFKTKPAK